MLVLAINSADFRIFFHFRKWGDATPKLYMKIQLQKRILPENPQKYYVISIATKSTLTIKTVAHLTIGIKFNISFMRNNSFYETLLNFSHFSSQIQKMCTFSILVSFCSNCKFENANMFNFSSSTCSESFNFFK